MKNTISILSLTLGLLVSVFAFTACGSDDDDDNGSPSNPLVGTWTVISSDNDDLPVGSKNYFKSDGSFSSSAWNYDTEYSLYTVQKDILQLTHYKKATNDIKVAYKGQFVISGKKMTFTHIYYSKKLGWENHTFNTIFEKQ